MAPIHRAATNRSSFALAALSTIAITGLSPATAEPGAAELGVWINHTGRGAVELYKCGSSVCGRIVWVRDPKNDAGKPRTDINNPDPGRRGRAICGLVTFTGLKRTSSGWGDGQGYNPEDGTSFNVSIQLAGANALKVTGSKLIFSKTVYWKRPTSEVQRCDRPAVPATPPPQIAAPKSAEPPAPAKAAAAVETVEKAQAPAPAPKPVAAAPQAVTTPAMVEPPPASSLPAPVKSAATNPAAGSDTPPAKAAPVTTTVAPVAPIVAPTPPKPIPATAPAGPAKQPAKAAAVTPPQPPAAQPGEPKPQPARPPSDSTAAKPAATPLPAVKAKPAAAPGQSNTTTSAAANAVAPPPNGGWPITGTGPKPAPAQAPTATPIAAPAAPGPIAPVAKKPPRKKPEIFDGTTIPMPVLQ